MRKYTWAVRLTVVLLLVAAAALIAFWIAY